nr:hypothetical protein [uncultured bacterium]
MAIYQPSLALCLAMASGTVSPGSMPNRSRALVRVMKVGISALGPSSSRKPGCSSPSTSTRSALLSAASSSLKASSTKAPARSASSGSNSAW